MAAVKANIIFNAVNIPVRVLPQSRRGGGVTFKTIHEKCGTPVKMPKTCPTCDVEVELKDTIKGFEVSKGNFVTFTDEEIASAKPDRSPIVTITKFIRQPDPLWTFDRHWLQPEEMHPFRVSYKLFTDALDASNLVGFGMSTNWGKEMPCYVSPWDGVLVLTRMLTQADYIAHPVAPTEVEVKQGEIEMFASFLENFEGELDESDLVSVSDTLMKSMIGAKVAGEAFEAPKVEALPEPTANILETLEKMMPKKKGRKKVAA